MSAYRFLPHIAELIKTAQESDAPLLSSLTPAEARAVRNPIIKGHLGPPEEVARVEDRLIAAGEAEIPIRVYTPFGRGPWPVVVYFHGGGWVVGDLETHDSLCRALTNGVGAVVVAVDYRLAPEHKFPAAVEDAYAATGWAADNATGIGGDPHRLAVAGDSAGGNLAAAVCLMARDRGGPAIGYQLLVYPVMDLSSLDTETYRDYADAFILTKDGMAYFIGHYLRRAEDALDPYASPLLAEDLSGLPPALIITAQYDVLTSEGRAYAERLRRAGVEATYSEYPGVIHLFFGMSALDRSQNGLDEAFAALKTALAGQPDRPGNMPT